MWFMGHRYDTHSLGYPHDLLLPHPAPNKNGSSVRYTLVSITVALTRFSQLTCL